MSKYAGYFKGNEILPIPEILQKMEPRIISLVVTDLKTRRLVGLKKEGFEDLLRKAGVPCRYYCRRSFATWDVLLPSREQAAKIASNHITTKFFLLQPEYLGTRRIRVTVCNVPAFITGEELAAFFSAYGRVEEINLLRSAAGTAYGDYVFRLCFNSEGFQAIPEVIVSKERQMILVVEGRRPRCWSSKQVGHIAKFCPKKDQQNSAATTAATATTTNTVTTATISSEPSTDKESGQAQLKKDEEGWTEVTRKKRKSPKRGEDKPATTSPVKNAEPASTPAFIPASVTEPIPAHITEHPVLPAAKASANKKPKAKTTTETPMETSTNLKRRRNSGEVASKKMCSGPSHPKDPLEGPSNAFPQSQPLPQQVPLQPPFSSPPPPPPPQHAPPKQQSPQTPQPLQPPQLLQQIEPFQCHHKLLYHFP